MKTPASLYRQRFVTLMMITLIIGGQTEVVQLFKLPVFISHFQQHREKLPTLTLQAFVYMHYLGSDMDSSDDTTDQQLPFKHHLPFQQQPEAANNHAISLSSPVVTIAAELHPAIILPGPQKTSFDIWQPPRLG